MPKTNQALKVAMAAVEQLPRELQRRLAEQVLRTVASDELLIVPLKRLSANESERLQELMDKNNDGLLTKSERVELQRLGAVVDQMMLENAKSLARIVRPELFDENGQLIEASAQPTSKSHTSARKKTSTRKGASA